MSREYEEDNNAWGSLTEEENLIHTGRSNDLDKLAEKHTEYAGGDKDVIPSNRHCLKENKSHTNSYSPTAMVSKR